MNRSEHMSSDLPKATKESGKSAHALLALRGINFGLKITKLHFTCHAEPRNFFS